MNQRLDPETLQLWLEWAGARIIAIPVRNLRPSQPKVLWPDYSQERFEVLDFRGKLPLKILAPAASEIPIMDLILSLPNVCCVPLTRRILHARALVNPFNNRHLFSWRKLGEKLHSNAQTIRHLHAKGLTEVCRLANPKHTNIIACFFGEKQNG